MGRQNQTEDPPAGLRRRHQAAAGSSIVRVPRQFDVDKKARVYGSRWVKDDDANFQEVPLTWEDLFDPQEGDHVVHSTVHGKTIRDTATRLDGHFEAQDRDDVLVCDDVKILWKNPALDKIAPDIAVIPDVKDPDRYRKSFNEEQEGTGPVFVLEVTSKETADFDRDEKPEIYRQAGVRENFLLDQMKSPWELSGERLGPESGDYVDVEPDERNRYLAETLGIYFSVAPSGKDLVLEDAATGEVIRKLPAEARARREAERLAAEEAEARGKEAEARQVAERQAGEETKARQAAERQAVKETEARRKEAEARQAAERQAAKEAGAREAAEAEVRKLLAEIERLKSTDD